MEIPKFNNKTLNQNKAHKTVSIDHHTINEVLNLLMKISFKSLPEILNNTDLAEFLKMVRVCTFLTFLA